VLVAGALSFRAIRDLACLRVACATHGGGSTLRRYCAPEQVTGGDVENVGQTGECVIINALRLATLGVRDRRAPNPSSQRQLALRQATRLT